MKSLSAVLVMFASVLDATSQPSWDAVGPYGGWINDLARDASGNIYAGTYLGGIFKTTNNGDTWLQMYNDTLIIDARSVGLNAAGDIFVGLNPGFLRSTNGGASWQKVVNALNNRRVGVLLVLPNDNILAADFLYGVYRSTNNGTTFTAINNGLTNLDIKALDVKTSNGYLFAATYGGGVFRSTDNGENWVAVNNGITGAMQMEAVAVSTWGDIFTSDGTTIFRSTNNGDIWADLTAPPGEGYSDFTFTANGIYASARHVYKSTDSGTTWTQQTGLPQINFTRLISSGVSVLAASSGRGVYRSNGMLNPNDTWTHVVNGMNNTHVMSIAQAPNADLYAATLNAGVFRSINAGLTWTETTPIVNVGSFLTGIKSVAVTPNGTVFIGSTAGRWRSTDQGTTWTQTGFTFTNTNVIACNDQGYVFADFGGFMDRSTNNGDTWTRVSVPTVQKIADIAFEGDTVYLATGVGAGFGTSRGVYRSTNNGVTWAEFNTGLTNLNVTTIAARESTAFTRRMDGNVVSRLMCGTWGSGTFRIVSAQSGEQDRVNEWEQCGPDSGRFKQVVLDPGEASLAYGLILGITSGDLDIFGLFANCNLEETRRHQHEVNCMEVAFNEASAVSTFFLIGTNGKGIQRTTNITSVEQTPVIPQRFLLEQSYPNPFNPSSTIKFQIPNSCHVVLAVYDVLGKEVATLVSEDLSPGSYETTFDGAALSSGVYFYRLQADKFFETKKFVLQK